MKFEHVRLNRVTMKTRTMSCNLILFSFRKEWDWNVPAASEHIQRQVSTLTTNGVSLVCEIEKEVAISWVVTACWSPLYIVYQYKLMLQPPYNPDKAPYDFWLFPKRKEPLQSQTFSNLFEIPCACQDFFKTLTPNDFVKVYKRWKERWTNASPQRVSISKRNKLLCSFFAK